MDNLESRVRSRFLGYVTSCSHIRKKRL